VIQRFCFAVLRDDEVAGRAALAGELARRFAAAGADAVVGVPADESAIRWDLSIVITAVSLEAWTALAASPAIAAAFDALAARAGVVKAWTFEAVPPLPAP
jgi:hypothetical protein